MPKACNHCGCTEIDTDPSRGDVICTNCGTVLEDQIIVSEVQYQENATGGASVIGQFVSNDGTRAQSFRGAYGFSSEDSRKITLENGYKKLKELGHQVRMHQSSIDTAFGFFKIAVANKFTRGRKMDYVLASCLYLVCRVDPGGSEDLELMLIDFSDMIQVNVHVLGRTFVQLATELCQNIRIVDPVIYIRRFANQLYFGDKLNKVVESASRLVARMKRDWMHTGRRPAGLCGAAILISARMHNFNRTVDQVIKVVKVCENTVRKRLLEFDSTPSAQLTIEEFDNVDLEAEQDPPCFTEGKKKSKLAQEKLMQNDGKLSDSVIKEMNKFQENITKSLKYHKKYPAEKEKEVITDDVSAVKVLDEEIVREAAGSDWDESSQDSVGNTDPMNKTVIVIDDDNPKIMKKEEIESDSEESKKCIKTKSEEGELDLTGIDDKEIDSFLMSKDEVAQKTHWFNLEFGEHMKIVREREERKRLKEEEAMKKREKNPRSKKKKKKSEFDVDTMRAECMEILKKDMMEKKFSDKINYSVLSNLGTTEATDNDNGPSEKEPIDITDEDPLSKPQLLNRFRKSSISESQSDRKRSNKAVKRVQIAEQAIKENVKKAKVEEVEEVPVVKPDVIEISAEPRPYEEQEEPEDLGLEEEDDEDYDEDEEEDKIVTARQLLSQDVSGYEEEEDEYLY